MRKKQLTLILSAVLLMAALSAGLLLLLTAITFYAELGAETVTIAIRGIYVLSCLAGGLFAGKTMKEKKFLWGLGVGMLYFLLLMLVSLGVGERPWEITDILTALVLTAPAGMLGGMLG